jgi:hypothetical protein
MNLTTSLKAATWCFSITFICLGLFFLLYMPNLAQLTGSQLHSDVLIDLKAVYGGLHIGVGCFLVVQVMRKSYREALLLAFCILSALAVCRILGIMTSSAAPHLMTLSLLAVEIVGVSVSAVILKQTREAVHKEKK